MKREEIISKLIDEKFKSKRQFAEFINIPPTTLQSILKRGIGKASIDNVISICKGLGISIDDLERMAQDGVINSEATGKQDTNENREIPFFGNIAAGALFSVEPITGENLETVTVSKKMLGKYAENKKLFAMKVNGESMNKIIPNYSFVICKPIELEEVKEDDIVIFSYDGEYSMKKFRRDDEDQESNSISKTLIYQGFRAPCLASVQN